MRRLLKFTNYAAQFTALIDLGKAITKNDIKKQKERSKIKAQMTYPYQKPPITRNATD